jgi:hypothetical protein
MSVATFNGGNWRVVAPNSRKSNPASKLIIAKLDRLARNVAFVSNLMDSGVDFEAVDFPQANRLTIHILAAVAERPATN